MPSTADGPRVVLVSGAQRVPLAPERPTGASPVRGEDPCWLEAVGLPSGVEVEVRVGHRELRRTVADEGGAWRLRLDDVLHAVVGDVDVVVEAPPGREVFARIDVAPTRFARRSFEAMLADFDAWSSDLAGQLDGVARREVEAASPAEAALDALEDLVVEVHRAAPHVRAAPIVVHHEQVAAVAATTAAVSARDLGWIARNPHRTVWARAQTGQLAVERRVREDLDTPENRGVTSLLRHLDKVAGSVVAVIEVERARLEAERARMEALELTPRRAEGELRALGRRSERVTHLRDELALARARLGLPRGLRAGPFHRTARVAVHRGYGPLHRLWLRARDLLPLRPGPARVPLASSDELYERWCVVRMVHALEAVLGPPVGPTELTAPGWFATLRRGPLATFRAPCGEVRLLYEPEYAASRDGAGDPLVKLHGGRPYRPDVVLEERHGDHVIALHLFDAKHTQGREGDGRVPYEDVDRLWLKYPDGIGRARTLEPVVASCWALYPGPRPWVHRRSPAMLTPRWPLERPQGGAIALTPGEPETADRLTDVLRRLLRPGGG